MSRLSQPAQVAPLELFQVNSYPGGTYNYGDQNFVSYAGMRFQSQDGRWFALVQNGGTALAAGKVVASVAPTANHESCDVTAFTAYSANGNQPAQVTLTLGATAVTENEYAGGFLDVVSGTGIGQILQISGHPAADASASVVVTISQNEGEGMADLDDTSVVTLIHNPYGSQNGTNVSTNGVVVAPTSFAGQILGVSTYAIPASSGSVGSTSSPAQPSYGLIQTTGLAAAIASGTIAVGAPISPSTSTAGEIEQATSSTTLSTAIIGYAVIAGASAKANAVYLQL